jgi:TetR/AcrR family fatty acid metabolism transcriptional regulator
MPGAKRSKVAARGLRKRQQIMQAAERLFTSRRFHEITLNSVAAEAGVAKGTIYGYFKDKDDLFFQTSTSGFDELCKLIDRKAPDGTPFPRMLLGACRAINVFFQRRRQLMQMMQSEDGRMWYCQGNLRQRWLQKRKGLLSSVARVIAKGIEEGHLRKDVSPEVLAGLLLGMLRARARDLTDAPSAMRSDEVIVDLFCNGARADAG